MGASGGRGRGRGGVSRCDWGVRVGAADGPVLVRGSDAGVDQPRGEGGIRLNVFVFVFFCCLLLGVGCWRCGGGGGGCGDGGNKIMATKGEMGGVGRVGGEGGLYVVGCVCMALPLEVSLWSLLLYVFFYLCCKLCCGVR